MKINPNAPAYPCDPRIPGMPIRLAIAAQIMGHLAGLERRHDFTQEEDALYALEAADALIAAHNEEAA